MPRLIDVERFCADNPNFNSEVYVALSKAPTIDAKPVRHGRWGASTIVGYDGTNVIYARPCSECGYEDKSFVARYCPNCGAKMDGDSENVC